MSTLFLTRGLPASGKTTQARAWVAGGVLGDRIRLNRDDFRTMMFGGWTGLDEHEAAVTIAQHLAAAAFLRAGADVVCDDTNLRDDVLQAWRDLAAGAGAAVEVWDLTDVPLDTCQAQNELRRGTPAFVPPAVIEGMWSRYIAPPAGAQ